MISPYLFVQTLSDLCEDGDVIVVDGGGTNVYVAFQTFQIKPRQRMILSTGLCSMGSGLPEAIGACFGAGRRRTICLCGDGSFQLNVQELQTIRHHGLPIKIFVTNNNGYLSIRQTQDGFLGGLHAGSEPEGGMSLPDFGKVAAAYGFPAARVEDAADLREQLARALSTDGPYYCEIVAPPDQEMIPRQGFDQRPDGTFAPRSLEDMAPYLDRDELAKLMFIPLST